MAHAAIPTVDHGDPTGTSAMKSAYLRALLWCVACFGLPTASVAAEGPNAQKDAEQRWAFAPVKKVEPPADATGWSANPIDRFIRAKLQEHGLQPAGPADKRTL